MMSAFALCYALPHPPERGVNVDGVQRLADHPTRDVYVTRDDDGDREFAGFGLPGIGSEYADAHIDPERLPLDKITVGVGSSLWWRRVLAGCVGTPWGETRTAIP